MNGREYAERIGVAHGTVKRWLYEGMPANRGGRHLEIDADAADAWVKENRPNSVAVSRVALVYVVARSKDGAIKVGWTSNLERRLPELRKETGDAIQLIAAFPGSKPRELEIQASLAASRLDGEWFVSTMEVRAFVARLGEIAA